METVEVGNRLIAAFMGMKRHDHASYATWERKDGTHMFESVLQYNTSWDWLMPSWSKAYGALLVKNTTICHRIIDKMRVALINSNIKAAHKILIEAIEYINE